MRQESKEDWGIAEAAALWAIRMKEPDAERHRPEFERWCAQSQQHQVEFLLARATDFQLDALKQTSPSLQGILAAPQQISSAKVIPFRHAERGPASNPTPMRSVAEPNVRSRIFGWIAIGVALAILTLGMSWDPGALARSDEYATVIGQRRTISLEDGSVVTLNTASKIAVRFTEDERAIDLIEGEALFDVAEYRGRPFRVYSGSSITEDISTQFNVRRNHDSTEITVTDGAVRVFTDAVRNGASHGSSGLSARELRFGQRLLITDAGGALALTEKQLSAAEVTGTVTWRDGYLQFTNGTMLAEAVEEMNRYNERKIEIRDPQVAELRIGGRFSATAPEEFVKAVASIVPVKALQSGNAVPKNHPIQLVVSAP